MTLGEKIKIVLAEQERSQRWLARKVGLSANGIGKIVLGGRTSYTLAMRIAQALAENPLWMLDDTKGPDDRPFTESFP